MWFGKFTIRRTCHAGTTGTPLVITSRPGKPLPKKGWKPSTETMDSKLVVDESLVIPETLSQTAVDMLVGKLEDCVRGCVSLAGNFETEPSVFLAQRRPPKLLFTVIGRAVEGHSYVEQEKSNGITMGCR
jgi:hypothetical protein